jgi:hypothetical protein
MAWGEWMVPKPGPEHLLTLERQKRAASKYNEDQAKQMLHQLCEIAMRQDLIIRGATKRIAELELLIVLGTGDNQSKDHQPPKPTAFWAQLATVLAKAFQLKAARP